MKHKLLDQIILLQSLKGYEVDVSSVSPSSLTLTKGQCFKCQLRRLVMVII